MKRERVRKKKAKRVHLETDGSLGEKKHITGIRKDKDGGKGRLQIPKKSAPWPVKKNKTF